MSKPKKHRPGPVKAGRPSFPGDEETQPWLALLLEAYHIVDRGIARALEAEQKRGRKPACAKGCSHCCRTHKDIPVYPLELTGISWYVTEKIEGRARDALRDRLEHFKKDDPCPFLAEDACSIHPVRPMACRQFNVLDRPCEEGEDPYYTRRSDVQPPVKKYVDQAFFIMLPFYGVEKESERARIVETGAFHKMVRELHCCNWKGLAGKMRDFDLKKGPGPR
ncbi:MAG: YkgJ family cysteine cluster protein [Nitrospirae bacterium]|nr:YkgJ family cysteine cluster protein [Nitrospirota bacterium]